jgi:hypothetical protein
MPAAVAVCAVQTPVIVSGVVAELRDGLAGPVRSEVGMSVVGGFLAYEQGGEVRRSLELTVALKRQLKPT